MLTFHSNARVVAAEFGVASLAVAQVARKVVAHHAMLLQTRVKGRASGRPGPRAVTGDYRRSVARRVDFIQATGTTIGQVGTNSPQGRRLEFGFTGTDSLGRFYDQPPLPHFGPALDETGPKFFEDLADQMQKTAAGVTKV